ncbi:MAG: hypothetical protein EOO46_04600 [Flavobacterium sp.]|nr:MAG: hypothetical protein EOO46_04600 [Flavobacterium sp.]
MKTKLFFTALIVFAFSLFSCSSDDSGAVANPIVATGGFKWKENGGNFIEADSAFFASQYTTIKAYKAGKFIEINLTAGTAGTYAVGSANAIAMLTASDLYVAIAGSLIVSENASGKMSGTFTSTGSGAGVTALEGSFDDIEIR